MEPNQTVRIAGYVLDSIVDGPGIRYTLFTQGCPHNCAGCHNPVTHAFDGGKEVPVAQILADIQKNSLLEGVTLSGGEPFMQAEKLIPIAAYAKERGLNLWIYSGWTYEQLLKMGERTPSVTALLSLCDVLVDGPFVLAERSLLLEWRGSRNQRLIDLNRTREQGAVVLYRRPSYLDGFEPPRWG